MRRSVLLVEDEESIRELVNDYFVKSSWEVVEAANGEEAMDLFKTRPTNLVILDLMIPRIDGWSVCKRIRAASTVPIIILTAKFEEESKLLGFELGADDYVTKPFSPRVLVARAETLMKRVEQTVGQENFLFCFGNTIVNENKRTVEVNGQMIELSYKEYDILIHFLKNKNLPLSREHLLNLVWGIDYYGDSRVVDTHVKNLRKKLKDDAQYIHTVFRIGYKFEEPS
ncbi:MULTISPECIES: response regulator transcription factor [unclassified Paenibacillus]|uniref:response regulator transcription factor n=1 Tax=Paenibacillus TaxID=44249 RepID=UPI0007BFA983|nr:MULTISPECIES: response regulator transcription factor [unclassified Paenibacillus]SEB26019.1 DNA-binding response regulator, OmpR family, contains REC and winged-helix (wHTH) domain [Paenibacillus sp. 276b]